MAASGLALTGAGTTAWLRLVWAAAQPVEAAREDAAEALGDRVAGEAAGVAGVAGDEVDIAATLGGDEQAYERLVRRHQDAVARQMWRFTRDRGVLEELVQEVFVQAYFSLGKYKARAPLSHWLSRIAVRVGYRHWRRKARQAAGRRADGADEADEAGADGQATALQTLEAREAAELVHAALAELGPADRLVVTLMHLEQRSVRETAELTGWTRAAVKVRALRARRRLGRVLQRRGWG